MLALPTYACAQFKIVLRSLREIESTKFEFDPIRIESSDGKSFYWDEIFSGSVAADQQQQFDAWLNEIGLPLFRARHRVLIGDFDSLAEIADGLHEKYAGMDATNRNCRCKFIMHLSKFCHRWSTAQREQAAVELIGLSRLVAAFAQELKSAAIPTSLTMAELEQCNAVMLVPVWFDQDQARLAVEQIQSQFGNDLSSWPDGQLIYITSLGIAAGSAWVNDGLSELGGRSSAMTNSWLPLLLAYAEIANGQPDRAISKLQNEVKKKSTGAQRAVAQYLLGMATASLNRSTDNAMLQLLYVPAVHGQQMPHLSAAALFEASQLAQRAGHVAESEALQAELKIRYPRSYHAKLLPNK